MIDFEKLLFFKLKLRNKSVNNDLKLILFIETEKNIYLLLIDSISLVFNKTCSC